MGFGGTDTPETPPVAVASPDEMNTEELQAASLAPITEAESTLYTPSGKACCWKDSEEFAFRLRQLALINHAISVLLRETWKDADAVTSFQSIHRDTMTFKNIQGNEEPGYEWTILSDDNTFTPEMEMDINRFKEFENYFLARGGASKDQVKKDFENFVIVFTRLRSWLMKKMTEFCSVTQSGGRWMGNGGSRPISRRSMYGGGSTRQYGGMRQRYDYY